VARRLIQKFNLTNFKIFDIIYIEIKDNKFKKSFENFKKRVDKSEVIVYNKGTKERERRFQIWQQNLM